MTPLEMWMAETLEWDPWRGMMVRQIEYWVQEAGLFARFVPDVTLYRGTA